MDRGQPRTGFSFQGSTACKVRVGNEEAYFVFSNGTVVSDANKCVKDLPPNTVLLIEFTLIKPAKLSAPGINKSFQNLRSFHTSQHWLQRLHR